MTKMTKMKQRIYRKSKLSNKFVRKGGFFGSKKEEGFDTLPNYKIIGNGLAKSVEVILENSTIITGRGNLQYMDTDIKADVHSGGIGSSIMRFLTDAAIFQLRLRGTGRAVFSNALPSDIIAIRIKKNSVFKFAPQSFICCTGNVEISGTTNFKGIFVGDDLFMNTAKLKSGEEGILWLAGYGEVRDMELKEGESLKIDNGVLLVMPDNIDYKIEKIGSVGASILGGEGVFMMKINGPANFKVSTKSVDALRNYVYGVATTAVERESKST